MKKTKTTDWAMDSLQTSLEFSKAEMKYYEEAFQIIGTMKYKTDEIVNTIKTYDNYFYKGKIKTITSMIFIVITGLLIPFLALFSNIHLFPLEVVQVFAGLGFGLSTIIAILLIYRDISKF